LAILIHLAFVNPLLGDLLFLEGDAALGLVNSVDVQRCRSTEHNRAKAMCVSIKTRSIFKPSRYDMI
jgi:hypothetical protein